MRIAHRASEAPGSRPLRLDLAVSVSVPLRGVGCGPCASTALSRIGLTAAVLFAGWEVPSADSRVRSPGTLTCTRYPAVRSALGVGPEACDNPVAVWWGPLAASAAIRGLVAGAVRRETRSGHRIQDGKPRVHDSNQDLAMVINQMHEAHTAIHRWGYEPYDVRLRCLGQPPVTALT
jgi:hypothetical protein